jgi:phage terminase small subunit
LTENKIKGRKRIIETLKGFMMPEDIGRYFARISKLKQKQEDFCHYFAICLNAKHAAILAGYSERSARWIGPALLKKREIKSRIYEWHEETWGKAFRENARKRMIEEEERKEMKKHAALSRKR